MCGACQAGAKLSWQTAFICLTHLVEKEAGLAFTAKSDKIFHLQAKIKHICKTSAFFVFSPLVH